MKLNIKSQVEIQTKIPIRTKIDTDISGFGNIFHLSPNGSFPVFSGGDEDLSRLRSMSTPSIVSERMDDIPLIISILLKLDLPNIIDKYYIAHGNHEGLSHGWLLTIWIVYILSRGDHRMSSVQEWVSGRCSVLSKISNKTVSDKDFTDDRLAKVLKILYDDKLWSQIEEHISQHTIRVYNLPVKKIRLDATTAVVNHNPANHPLFQVGLTKQNTYQAQFKVMLGTLDSLGLAIATDVVSGDKADDPLYIPTYKRIHKTLNQLGVLYIGDSKMAAIETRGTIDDDGNFYLMPLPMTGETPKLLDKLLSGLKNEEHEIINVFLPEDIPENPDEKPNPELAIAKGFEVSVERETKIKGKKIKWTERVCCVQSFGYARSQIKALDNRLIKADEALKNLTPPPGRGKKQYQDEKKLKIAANKVLKRYKVQYLIDYTTQRQETHRKIRAYKDNPARIETTIRYQIDTKRKVKEIEQAKSRLGWRIYATNSLAKELSFSDVVLTYRDQYIIEQNFSRLKGRRIGITPLYVQRDDHACGLIRLLTIALRAMSIIEFSAREKLLQDKDVLQGIYPGNPKRSTVRPSADMMLKAFNGLDFFITDLPNGLHFEQISSLNYVQKKILYLLDLPEQIYSNIARSP